MHLVAEPCPTHTALSHALRELGIQRDSLRDGWKGSLFLPFVLHELQEELDIVSGPLLPSSVGWEAFIFIVRDDLFPIRFIP